MVFGYAGKYLRLAEQSHPIYLTNILSELHAHDAIDAEPGCSRESAAIIADPLGAAVLAADRRSTVSRLVRPPPRSQQF